MRKTTKEGKRKKRLKAMKLLQSTSLIDNWKGRKLMKQANKIHSYSHTSSNY